ncbi:protein NYNRIN-like [Cucumis melo var. makuwa]|uniref:Protein NYNRIN-like n=1 Tax=Cucumis melo var. makuwa TaxID=1194695 RepID=A0A5D3C214_CUCMM|nr:protein NYNRIN-like [Cucumis melo var. makuwa]
MEPWTIYFDGTTRKSGAGADIVLISPEKYMLPYSSTLTELCLNNMAEYQALIIGLQMALEIGVSLIEIYRDSKLIINQLSLQYDVKHEDLKPYFAYARQLMERFDSVMLEHVLRTENKRADALANLATALMMSDNEANVTTSHLIDEEDWRQPIIEYLEHGKLPKDSRHKTKGLDLVGLIKPKSSAGHSYILAATDYFSKWAEAIPLGEVKKENVANFIHTHIIYRYGIPHRIVTDNRRQFSNSTIDKLCEKFKFKQYKSSMYNAATNGLAKAFNKTLCNLVKKIVSKSKKNWQEIIDEAL